MNDKKFDFSVFRNNKDLVFLDYAATTFMPDVVMNAWYNYHSKISVSYNHGNGPLSEKAETIYKNSKKEILNFFHANNNYNIIFEKNATECLNILAYSLINYIHKGDIIVMGPYEHHSNVLPWNKVAEITGSIIVQLPSLENGKINYKFINKLDLTRIKVISISLISNINGNILNINWIKKIKQQCNAIVIIDACQAAGHFKINCNKINADAYVISSHKMYGPKNIAGSIIKQNLLSTMNPIILGGGMVWNALGPNPTFYPDAKKFEAGTFDIGLIYAWAKACEYIKSIGMNNIIKYEKIIFEYAKERFSNSRINIVPGSGQNSSILSFVVNGLHPHDIAELAKINNIEIRTGNMCAQGAIKNLGYNTICRISWGIGSTIKDIDKFADLLEKSYSAINYANNFIVLPDIIKESNGIACGDNLIVYISKENDNISFSFSGNSCSVAIKMANYLVKHYSGKNTQLVSSNIKRLLNHNYNNKESWMKAYSASRTQCLDEPLIILLAALNEKNYFNDESMELSLLACDACVSTKPINLSKDKICNSGLLKRYRNLYQRDFSREIDLQKLGMCVLNNKSKYDFCNNLKNCSSYDFNLIKKLRLPVLLLNNSIQYNLQLDKDIEELAIKQIVSLQVASEEINVIKKFIEINKLKIFNVKGTTTNRFYPSNLFRTHMDFDYLSFNYKDAFTLISYLINKRDFKFILTGGSVPFSFKSIISKDGDEILTSHIHLEKILQDKYQVIVDINIGGFPLGRTSIIDFKNQTTITNEDIVCITLAHVFKHEVVYMKDLNDLFFILSSKQINKNILENKIKQYSLSALFDITINFLKTNYGLNYNYIFNNYLKLSINRLNQWPFDRKAHLYIKYKYMLFQNISKFGTECGTKETISQICNDNAKIESKSFKKLTKHINERVYLYPLIIFNILVSLSILPNKYRLTDYIYISNNLLILNFGIFLIQNNVNGNINKDVIRGELMSVLHLLNVDENSIYKDYIGSVRRDTWLY